MTSKQNRLAIIPARGGSKRLPRKNIINFQGKPMLAWSIKAAQKSGLFENVYVSTEDQEIANIAQYYGAIWSRRSEKLACDRTSVAEVCLDFLEHTHMNFDTIVVLYPASPLRTSQDICKTVALIEEKEADLAMTVTELPYDPREILEIDKSMHADIWQEDQINIKRQDRKQLMIDAGSVYAARVSTFQKIKDFYGPNLMVHPIPTSRAVDIDTYEDLAFANFLAQSHNNKLYKKAS